MSKREDDVRLLISHMLGVAPDSIKSVIDVTPRTRMNCNNITNGVTSEEDYHSVDNLRRIFKGLKENGMSAKTIAELYNLPEECVENIITSESEGVIVPLDIKAQVLVKVDGETDYQKANKLIQDKISSLGIADNKGLQITLGGTSFDVNALSELTFSTLKCNAEIAEINDAVEKSDRTPINLSDI